MAGDAYGHRANFGNAASHDHFFFFPLAEAFFAAFAPAATFFLPAAFTREAEDDTFRRGMTSEVVGGFKLERAARTLGVR